MTETASQGGPSSDDAGRDASGSPSPGARPMVRPYRAADAGPTLRIFERAVTVTARSRYTEEQVQAWLGAPMNLDDWHRDRQAVETFVAEVDGRVAGFTDLAENGYVDRLFVDPQYGRRGVATGLLEHLARLARARGIPQLSTHASLVARPVFEAAGFEVVERETVRRGEIELDRFLMATPDR